MRNANSKYSQLYLIVPPGVAGEALSAIRELEARDFHVISDWHRPGAPKRHLILEINHMLRSDVVLAWPSGLGAEDWIKLGAAHAAGLRLISIGPMIGLDEAKQIFMIDFEGGFGDFLSSPLSKITGLMYKKPKREEKDEFKKDQ